MVGRIITCEKTREVVVRTSRLRTVGIAADASGNGYDGTLMLSVTL